MTNKYKDILQKELEATSITNKLWLPYFLVKFNIRQRALFCNEIKKLKEQKLISLERTSASFMENPKTKMLWVKTKEGSRNCTQIKSLYFIDEYIYSHIYLKQKLKHTHNE